VDRPIRHTCQRNLVSSLHSDAGLERNLSAIRIQFGLLTVRSPELPVDLLVTTAESPACVK
ncbi:MAG TPA: hypothetical protein VK526_13240, partial [Bradyrhizobium sp.]|nr:hypothetical protein [Bradyrhizobium sp.]